jgi:hypothetical protein
MNMNGSSNTFDFIPKFRNEVKEGKNQSSCSSKVL